MPDTSYVVSLKFRADDAGAKSTTDDVDGSVSKLAASAKKALAAFLAWRTLKAVFTEIKTYMGEAAEKSREYETALIGVQKTTGFSDEAMRGLSQSFLDLSTKMSTSAVDLANIAAVAGQLGIGTQSGAEGVQAFTESIAKGTIALPEFTGGAEELATAAAKLLNLFGLNVDQVDNLLSSMNALANTTAANAKQIGEFMQKFTAAKNLGIAADEAAALGATFISLGQDASDAGTRLQTAITMMVSSSEKMGAAADIAGMSLGDFTRLAGKDMVGAIKKVVDGLGDMEGGSRKAAVSISYVGVSEEEAKRLTDLYADALKDADRSLSEFDNAIRDADEAAKRYNDTMREADRTMRDVERAFRDATRTGEDIDEVWSDYERTLASLQRQMAETDDMERYNDLQEDIADAYRDAQRSAEDLADRQDDMYTRANDLQEDYNDKLAQANDYADQYYDALAAQEAAQGAYAAATNEAAEAQAGLNEKFVQYGSSATDAKTGVDVLQQATEIFGQVGARALMTLVGNLDELDKNLVTANTEFERGKSILEEHAIASKATDEALKTMRNSMDALQTTMGDGLNPMTEALAKIFTDLFNEIRGSVEDIASWTTAWMESSESWAELMEDIDELIEAVGVFGDSGNTARDIWIAFLEIITKGTELGVDFLTLLVRAFSGDWRGVWEEIKEIAVELFLDTWDLLVAAGEWAWGEVLTKSDMYWVEFQNWWKNTAGPWMRGMWDDLLASLEDTWLLITYWYYMEGEGIIEGIFNAAGSMAADAFKYAFEDLFWKWFKGGFLVDLANAIGSWAFGGSSGGSGGGGGGGGYSTQLPEDDYGEWSGQDDSYYGWTEDYGHKYSGPGMAQHFEEQYRSQSMVPGGGMVVNILLPKAYIADQSTLRQAARDLAPEIRRAVAAGRG